MDMLDDNTMYAKWAFDSETGEEWLISLETGDKLIKRSDLMERTFDRTKDCAICKRYIDEVGVKLKKIIIGPDTFRRHDLMNDPNFKYEKICTECHGGKK